MRGTVIRGTRDIRLEDRDDPTIVHPTDAIVRTVATCVCGSDLWRYRGIQQVTTPTPIGHEYVVNASSCGSMARGSDCSQNPPVRHGQATNPGGAHG